MRRMSQAMSNQGMVKNGKTFILYSGAGHVFQKLCQRLGKVEYLSREPPTSVVWTLHSALDSFMNWQRRGDPFEL